MDRVAIALGSNLGDRRAHLDFAVSRLAQSLANLRVSSYHETAPVDVPVDDAPAFLNAAAVGETSASPHDVLEMLMAIEREQGRERPFQNAPRTLDLDLILFGDVVMNDATLTIPHPRFRDRMFVLRPLVEIAPDLVDPVTGSTVAALEKALRSSVTIEILEGVRWGQPTHDSHLVRTVHALRQKPIAEFSIEDFRIMLSQEVGVEHLVPEALSLLEADPFSEGDFYPGDLLGVVMAIRREYWVSHTVEAERMEKIANRLEGQLESRDETVKAHLHQLLARAQWRTDAA